MNSGRPSATALAAADYAGWAFVYGLLLVAVGFILAVLGALLLLVLYRVIGGRARRA